MASSARPTRSLRARLLGWLAAAIALAVALQAGIAYRTAHAEADALFDFQMQQMALSLRTGLPLTMTPGGLAVDGEALEGFVVQVWTLDGLPIFRSGLRALPERAVLGFSQLNHGGSTWRVFAVASRSHVIEVAQDMAVRRSMAGALALRTIAPIALMAPVLLALMGWVVGSSLAPLARVRGQVASRRADDLTPVGEEDLPDEVRPLIQELNLLFSRLQKAFEAQQSFVADAAHELRSPLAALRLQAQALGRSADAAARDRAVERLLAGIDRATRLVEQLLVLARQQASAAQGAPADAVSLADILRQELAEAAAAAQAARIDLGLLQADAGTIAGHRDALRILVRNLLDNALKYTPAGGRVDVAWRRDGGQLVLTVDDSGPGIAPAERERVLDRFYRVAGAPVTGSGLGLAIVRSVAELHGAELRLEVAPDLGGLRVVVRFPAPRP